MAAPTISTKDPAVGELNVVLNKVINITFDQALLASTVTTANFGVRHSSSNTPVRVAVAYTAATTTVSLTPETQLWKNSTFKVTVIGLSSGLGTGNVQNAGGEDFATTETWTFSTGDDIDAANQKTDTVEDREGDLRLPIGLEVTDAAPFQLTAMTPANGSWGFTGQTMTLTFNQSLTIQEAAANTEILPRPFLDEQGWYAKSGATFSDYAFEWDTSTWADESSDFFDDVTWVVTGSTAGVVTITTTGQVPRNCMYEVIVSQDLTSEDGNDLESDYSVVFTTQSWPDHTTPITIRNEVFTIFDTLNLEFVHQVVWKWMVDAYRLAGHNTAQFALQQKGKYLKDYVRAGSVMDIMEALFMKKAILAGQTKTLGDFTVSYHPSAGDLGKNSVYTQMKKKLDESKRAISFSAQTMRVFIKGWNSGLDPINFRTRLWKNPDVYKNYDGQVRPEHIPVANTEAQRASKLPGSEDEWS